MDALAIGSAAGLVPSGRSMEELEAVIERGLGSFLAVGQALLEIREGGRYRERGFDTFEAYCEDWLEIRTDAGLPVL